MSNAPKHRKWRWVEGRTINLRCPLCDGAGGYNAHEEDDLLAVMNEELKLPVKAKLEEINND